MKIYKKLFILGLVLVALVGFTTKANAMTPVLSLASSGSDSVLVTVTGDSNSSVVLYYNLTYGMQSAVLGTTNYNGYFSTTLNRNSYNLTAGSLVYVTVNGYPSASMSWPSYSYYGGVYNPTSMYGVVVTNLNLSIGNSITLASPNNSGLYVASNSNPAVAGVASQVLGGLGLGCNGNAYSTVTGQPCYLQNYYQPVVNNTSVTISALSAGSTVINLCQTNNASACSTVSITVNNSSYVYTPGVYNPGSVLGASTCYIGGTLRYGMSGAGVDCLRTLLAAKGYLFNSNYSSYFDFELKNAVMAFQQAYGLYPVDGIVGARTRSALMSY